MNSFLTLFESRMKEVFEEFAPSTASQTREAMAYMLFAGGKRFRPYLMFQSYQAANLRNGESSSAANPDLSSAICEDLGLSRCIPNASLDELVLDFGTALECIHSYSLIHDDLPCMDDDDMRRGRPTVHKVYGEAVALLAGDGLLNLAAEIMASRCRVLADRGEHLFLLRAVRAMDYMLQASGSGGMILGQEYDMNEAPLTFEFVKTMDLLKTGALVRAAIVVGALLGGVIPSAIPAYEELGDLTGLVFQITDDLLDRFGDEKEVGKTLRTDVEQDKKTMIRVLGIEKTNQFLSECVARALELCDKLGLHTLMDSIRDLVGRKK